MIGVQVLGLRDYVNPKTGKSQKTDKFFEKNWRAENIVDLFSNIDHYISMIPEEERWNLYYTAANCTDKKRELLYQEVIPFDVDNIDLTKIEDYVSIFLGTFGLTRNQVIIVASGNGIQFLIGTTKRIESEEQFDSLKHLYKGVCGVLAQQIYLHGLVGNVDTSVFSASRLLRLPKTENRKDGKPTRQAVLLNGTLDFIDFDMQKMLGLPEVAVEDQISPSMLKRFSEPDAKGVQEGCGFLKWCKENQGEVREPEWYAMLSIIGRLPEGFQLAHEYSNEHPSYNRYETENKIEQAVANSGPRTCDNISTMFNGCKSCKHYGKITSPIQIKGTRYIATRNTGFHNIVVGADGVTKKGKPNYEDLMLYFEEQSPFVVQNDSLIVYRFTGKKYEAVPRSVLFSFAEKSLDPKPTNQICSEFFEKIRRNNLVDASFFVNNDKLNFKNGVLDLASGKLLQHSPKVGFKYFLPFDYDPHAEAPRFEKFLDEITLGDKELQAVLLEFMAYTLTYTPAQMGQKALILTGDGANGKSVLIDVLKYLAGEGNYSSISMGREINDMNNRQSLDGKLFNASEETPSNAMMDNTTFKALVTGGEVTAKLLYHDTYPMKNNAKIIMACNELPLSQDNTYGMYRRLLIVPFNAQFRTDTADVHLRAKLYAEASGIFNLIMEAFHRFKVGHVFTTSAKIEEQMKEYMEDNDSFMQWVTESVRREAGAEIKTREAFDSYILYCDLARISERDRKSRVSFNRRLSKFTKGKPERRGREQDKVISGYKLISQQKDGGEF